ncbi:HAD-IA family hydrolase [Tritonibacter scottomollicae]|uniref:Phosphoglycolate phosphatase n=1 Tax=Tritonibacter scottomollicae TaxID=483013 RepID=A0A2T1A994_TRISK|nr:HAD-IA family hydrolase [Tritonibacter scottomollicae]PRZ45160.1 phosphoglycolate phosphatase [Tritonibacter scottomollicae]
MSGATTGPLRLILFDVDGTLVDSQGTIVACMTEAFVAEGLEPPQRAAILSIVGLSLPQALAQLAAAQTVPVQEALVAGYKRAYQAARLREGAAHSPLYPGARAALDTLHAVPEYLLGVATGKSQRGLDALIEGHDLTMFVTRQVADHHPSKPHPSMILTAMSETGIPPADTVMIGDTTFDMEMGRAAGVTTIGVDWGYHAAAHLRADHMLSDFGALPDLLRRIWPD